MSEGSTDNRVLPPEVKVEETPSGDIASYGGATIEEQLQNAISSNGVVVFAKTTCAFCNEVKATFDTLDAAYVAFNINLMSNGSAVQAALTKLTGQTTVPYVYINKEFVGGCDSTKELQQQGKLLPKLQAAGALKLQLTDGQKRFANIGKSSAATTRRVPRCLFSFPDTVDDRAVRLNGVWGFIICLLVAIYWKRRAAHWVMVGLMVDFVLRFLAGGVFSPLGAFSMFITSVMELFGSKPRWTAGPPKQFASLCGVMFSSLASLFFLTYVHEHRLRIVGLSFTCALGAATFMEGFLGFCLGCYMFGWAVWAGICPKDIYTVHANTRAEVDYTWHEMCKRLNEGPAKRHTKRFLESTPAVIDYTYKAKTDDQTREDFDIIKHTKISHFVMHLSIVGVAVAWKFAAQMLNAPDAVWQAIGIGGATWATIWAVLYLTKCALYPRKVAKEWMHNTDGNAFALPFICFVLYAYLITDNSWQAGYVFFWFGAGISMFLSIIRVGDWIATRKDIEHVNAAWMIFPVSHFVTALVGGILDQTFVDAMQFWFAFAFIMWVVLFAITFYKAIVHTDNDDRVRASLGAWITAPAVAAVAYWVLYGAGYARSLASDTISTPDDFVFINLHWFSITMFLVLAVGFLRPFFARVKFDMSYWMAGFPMDALALTAILAEQKHWLQYSNVKPGGLSRGIAYAALAAASGTNVVLGLHTLSGIVRRRVFVPDYKWGPLSFMKLTHEAFKETILHMQAALEAVETSGGNAVLVGGFRQQWLEFVAMHHEHSRHEDAIVFPIYAQYFPHVADRFHTEHEEHHQDLDRVTQLVNRLGDSGKDGRDDIVSELKTTFAATVEHVLAHLDGESDHLQGIPRRYLPLEMHKQIVRKVWEQTPAESWFDMLPWVVNNLPMLHQRVRFIKTFLWAMPERAQQMGMMIALGVDAVQWRVLTDELPELIPRGADGWMRYY